MSGTDAIVAEFEKAASLVATARKLLTTGTMVDLTALEEKIRNACTSLLDLAPEQGRPLMPVMEALITDLDLLASAIQERSAPLSERLGPFVPG